MRIVTSLVPRRISRVFALFVAAIAPLVLVAAGYSQVNLSATQIGFPSIAVGTTSGAQTVNLTNAQAVPLTISGITASGPFTAVGCPLAPNTLAAGASCLISVTFKPVETGFALGQLTITDNAGNSPSSVNLFGQGSTGGATTISVPDLSFGNVALNIASASQSVTLTNNTGSTINVSPVTVPSPFSITANTCSTPLPAGHNCSIGVTMTPTAITGYTGVLSITDGVDPAPVQVYLFGAGVNAVTLSPSPFAFGNVPTGAQTIKYVTLTNNLTTPITISGGTITGTGYSLLGTGTTCPHGAAQLAGGATCVFAVGLQPSAVGSDPATLTLNDSAPGSPQTLQVTANGVAQLTVSPTAVNFGSVPLNNASALIPVLVQNNLTTSISFSSIALSGGAAFSIDPSSTCTTGSSILGGGSCVVNLSVTPTVLGGQSATLTIKDNATNSPQTVSVVATGSLPVALSAASLSFGNVVVNTPSAAQTLTLTNSQTASLAISSVLFSGPFSQAAVAPANPCPASGNLASGASCNFSIVFKPTAAGLANGQITVLDSAGNSPQTATLSGTGIAATSITPSSLSFGNVAVGTTSATQTFNVMNQQTVALHFASITVPAPYSIVAGSTTCSPATALAAGASCTVGVALSPTAVGVVAAASVTITDDAGNSPQTVALTGTGVGGVTINPSPINFGTVITGVATTQLVTVTNNTLGTITFSGGGASGTGYSIQSTTCGQHLAAGASCTSTVSLTAPTAGNYLGTFSVIDNVAGSPQTANLVATTVTPVVLSPASLTFPAQLEGTTSGSQSISLTNELSTPLTISTITTTGANPGDFSVTTGCALSPATVASMVPCSINVTFTPSGPGTRTATLNIMDNAVGGVQTVTLTGSGNAPLTITPPSALTYTAPVGTSSTYVQFTVTNTSGTGPIHISGFSTTGDFAVTQTNCPLTPAALAMSASCLVTVNFDPTIAGTRGGQFIITDDQVTSPQVVNLQGTGTSPLTVSTNSVIYAATKIGTSSPAINVVLTNHETQSETFNVAVTGPFSSVSNCPGGVIAANSSCLLVTTFSPTASGPANGSLTVTHSAANGSPVIVSLSGSGLNTNPPGAVSVVSPGAGMVGAVVNVTITGNNWTTFGPSSVITFTNESTGTPVGITATIPNPATTTANTIQAQLTIDPAAVPGARDIQVTTGSEVDTLSAAFIVANSTNTHVITSATPNQGTQGQNLNVNLTATGTNFVNGVTFANFGDGIQVNSLIVTGPTTAQANISISNTTYVGYRTITLVTGGEVAVSSSTIFQILPNSAAFVSITPNSAAQGASLSVNLVATGTHFLQDATTLSIGGGVNVGEVNVTSLTTATAQLAVTPGATVGVHNATISTGGEIISLNNAFTVTGATPYLASVTPSSAAQGQMVTLNITGVFTHFTTGVLLDLGGDVAIGTTNVIDDTHVQVQVTPHLDAAVSGRTGSLTVGPNGNQIVFQFGFTVTASAAQIISVTPNSAPQGGQLTLAVVGLNTHWVQGTTMSAFYPQPTGNIVVNQVTVTDATHATLNISVSTNDPVGGAGFYLATGGEVVSSSITIYAQTPTLSMNPSNGMPGTSFSVSFTGAFTHFDGTTLPVVSGQGVTLSNFVVTNNVSAKGTITIAPGAVAGIRTVTFTTGGEIVTTPFNVVINNAFLYSITPYQSMPGTTLNVEMIGVNTHFAAGSTQVLFDPFITVNSTTVHSATDLTANITIAANAFLGYHVAYVSTGTEQVIIGFGVIGPQSPSLVGVTPASAAQGATANVTITGNLTNWVQGTTEAILGAGVTVSNLQITSPTTATATVSVSPTAPVGGNSVIMITGPEIESGAGFSVTPNSATIKIVQPACADINYTAVLALPPCTPPAATPVVSQLQTVTYSVVGIGTHWLQGETTLSFGPNVSTDNLTILSPTDLIVQITVLSGAPVGFTPLTVVTDGETVTLQQAIDIESGFPVLLSTAPGSAVQGATLNLQLLGRFTHWAAGSTNVAFNKDITVNSVNVIDSQNAIANITVSPLAYVDTSCSPSGHTVTITTGSEQVSLPGTLCIGQGAEQIVSVNPAIGVQGSTESVTVTGSATHFVQGVTTASFGSGIDVGTVNVTSPTTATVALAITTAAPTGYSTVTLQTLGETASQVFAFQTTPGVATLTEAIPNQAEQGAPLAGQPTLNIHLIGQYSHFSAQSTATFGQGITVNSVTFTDATDLTVNITVDPLSYTGGRTVTVTTPGVACSPVVPCAPGATTGSEIVSNNAFSVIAGPAIITQVAPATGNQGQEVVFNITGSNTHWQQGVTQFYISGGGGDLTINSAVINSATSATVDMTISNTAGLGARSVYMITGGESLTDSGAFVITGGIPVITYLSPNNAQPGTTGLDVTIHGLYTQWDNTTTLNFGAGITVTTFQVENSTTINAVINIDPAATNGYRTVFVQTGMQALASNFQVYTPAPPVPGIYYMVPSSGLPGQTFSVSISGVNTHWDPATTTGEFGNNITVNTFQVTSPTSILANITISPTAPASTNLFTITTGTQNLTVGFNIVIAQPRLSVVDPGSGLQGANNLNVNIIGQYTTFDSTTTFNFGSGITVNSSQIIGPTIATANISIAQLATLGGRSVIATTEGVPVSGAGFSVTPSLALISGISPNTALQGQSVNVEVTGMNTHWDFSTVFTFGAGIVVGSTTVNSPTDATLTLVIPALASEGATYASAQTSGEIASISNGFVVQPGTPLLLSSGPGSIQQQSTATFTILSQATTWLANPPTVSYGTGITLTNVQVTGNTSLTVDGYVQPTTPTGYRNLTVTSGTQVLTLNNVLYVTNGPAVINTISPTTGGQGVNIPSLAITGTNTHWQQGVTALTFPGAVVNSLTINSPTSATANITITTSVHPGLVSLTMTTAGESASEVNAFEITQTQPQVLYINSANVAQGATQNVTVTAIYTSFSNLTVANFGAGVTVNSFTANSATSATVNLTVQPTAALGGRTVTFTTGAQVATASGLFNVTQGPAAIFSLSPNTGAQNNNYSILVTGSQTNFASGVTTASFGGGITVTNIAVVDALHANVAITIPPATPVGNYTATLTTMGENASILSGFSVTSGTASITSVSPSYGHPGDSSLNVTLTGLLTNWVNGTSVASFGAGITVNSLTVNSATSAVANITISSAATPGSRTVTVTTSGQVATMTSGFSVLAASSVTANGGTPQSATVNTNFATALSVLVKDTAGNPVNGATVTFTVPASGASATFSGASTAVTNASGIATSSTVKANATIGAYSVTAAVAGVGSTATFALTNTAAPPASVAVVSGTPQSATINTAFAATLQVVVKDAGSNPVSGITVTFGVPASGASATFSGGNTAVTNASGIAVSNAVSANATAGTYSINATVAGVASPAVFSLTNNAGAASSVATSTGSPQTATVGTAFATPFVVVVKDAGSNPVSGVSVTFTAPATGASGTFTGSATVITNASGQATAPAFTANSTAGTYNVTATAAGVASTATFALTNTAASASTIMATAGTPQSAQVNATFAVNLQATVKDSGSNPVSGVTVTFTSPASSDGTFPGAVTTATAVTNASGVATAPAFTAGASTATYNVSASVPGVATPALFALTNTSAAPASITATTGTPQSATISTAFATSLSATVRDGGNNPVSGVTVTFTSPSATDGTFAGGVLTANAVTNASGVATAPVFTASSTATAYTITASTTGISPSATFALTNTAGAPASVTIYSGNNQSTIVNTAFTNSLSVIVRDSGNNPVSGVTVTFAAPGSGASATFAGGLTTATTNGSGIATSATISANATSGTYNVNATVVGVATPAVFPLTNTSGVPASVIVSSGNNQTTPVANAFPTNLSALVSDSGSNPVAGVTVTFTAPTSGATGTFSASLATVTATTNASGIATAPVFTANTTPGSYSVTATIAGVSTPATFNLTNTQGVLSAVTPNSGNLGQTLNVVLTGNQTHFVQGTTTATFGTGITVNSVTVSSLTSATVNITIATTTTLGGRNITVTTGSEVATSSNGFNVNQGAASLLSVSPNTGAQATLQNVVVTGSGTNFAQGVTTASFGPNIGINSVTVTDLTHATVNISIGASATLGTQTVTMTTGGESASLANAFTITAGTPILTTVNPGTGNQGDTADSIVINAQDTHFVQGTTVASFGAGITVTSLTVNSPTSATAVIAISPTASTGARTVTMTSGAEVASLASAFTVNAGVGSATANPNFAVQGTNPTIVITGSFTNFIQGTTTVNFNDGYISVGTVTVNGPTQLSVPIQINPNATVGARTITINTGGNIVTASFSVAAGTPSVTLISPNVGVPNSTTNIQLTGNFTNWTSGTTQVSFGAGIAVGGAQLGQPGPVTVNNSGSLTANIAIDPAAATGPRTVTVTTGAEVETVNSGFTVQSCTTTAALSIVYSPLVNATNVPLNPLTQVEFNAPINRTTVSNGDFYLYDTVANQKVPGTITIDATGRIITFTPSVVLSAERSFYLLWGNVGTGNQIQDTCGNLVAYNYFYFTTGVAQNTAGPTLLQNSPLANDIVSESAQVVLQFSAPINPITQPSGLVVSTGGVPVAGTYNPTANDAIWTFVPAAPLAAATTYTVTYSSALQDGAGNSLANPGSYTFKTTSSTDTSHGSVSFTDPFSSQTGVPTTIAPTFYYSRLIDPISVNSSNVYLYNSNTGHTIPTTVTVAANRLSVTLTPLQPLQPTTQYYMTSNSNIVDLNGNYVNNSGNYFVTGAGSSTTATTVATISPANGQPSAPVNTQIIAAMSAVVDPGTVNNSSLVVLNGATPVAGTVSLSGNQTLTFTPTAALSPSTTYTVQVGGFLDGNENSVTSFSSTFTTGSNSTPVTTALSVVSTVPASGATNVANNATITLNFSAPVDPITLSSILVRDQSNSYFEISGTWALNPANAAQAIFTPTTPYPASASINVYLYGYVSDLAGNTSTSGQNNFTFTVAGTADTSTFQVVGISPANGATGVGRNATIAITFNKSINRNTVNGDALLVFSGDTNITPGINYSSDGRTITLTPGPGAGATVSVFASSAITDLSGNALVPFTSSYTVSNDTSNTAPQFIQMLPANGASDVPQIMPITIYTRYGALNPATVNNTNIYVLQNGVLIQGSFQVASGGQAFTFTPAAPFAYGSLVQIFVNAGVQDLGGNGFSSYSGQFTIQGNPSTTVPQITGYNPIASATGVPANVLPQMRFDQQLLASSVSSSNVIVYDTCANQSIAGTASVVGGNIVQFTPASNLPTLCNTNPRQYYMQLNLGGTKVTNLDGVAVSGQPYFYFTVGSAPVTTAPTILSVAPQSGVTNVGVNAVIYAQFSTVIDQLSVTGSTIQISGGSQTLVPATISFDSTGTYAIIQPETPLPASTLMTIAINGVTDVAGNAVTPFTSTFTTLPSILSAQPQVIYNSIAANATNVPLNAVATVQFNTPLATDSINASTYFVVDTVTNQRVPGTIAISADATTLTFTPTSPLLVDRQYYYQVNNARDTTGNATGSPYWYFTTGSTTTAITPTVTMVNPTNNLTAIPTNVTLQLLFNEPIAQTGITGVTLKQGANIIPVTPAFNAAYTVLSLTPSQPLLANTVYTISATGVIDINGNVQTTPFTSTFTTGAGPDVTTSNAATVYQPQSGSTNVPLNIQVVFNLPRRVNPISLSNGSFRFYNNQNSGQFVPFTYTVSPNQMTITVTPTAPLLANTQYYASFSGAYDVTGNYMYGVSTTFNTGTASSSAGASVVSISPTSGQTGVPLNVNIVATMSNPINPTTLGSSPITLMAGATVVPGTTTLASDYVTLTFVPSANLAAGTLYNVSIGGFTDENGNAVQTGASSFTTAGAVAPSFAVNSFTPANGSTISNNTSQIVITFNQNVNPTSVLNNTILVRDQSLSYDTIAGSWAVSGATATFTPLSPYPASHVIQIYTNGVLSEAGGSVSTSSTFTAAATADTTSPTVTSVTPINGSTNVGGYAPIVITFSKTMNPATINTNTITLFSGDTQYSYNTNFSSNARSVTITPSGGLPFNSLMTISVTPTVTDLSGNAVVPFQSQFTTAPQQPNSTPYVISQIPGNGATGIAPNTTITLYTNNDPISASTLNSNSFQVVQNGMLVSGSLAVVGNGHTIVFTPSSAFNYGALVQFFTNSGVTDAYGNSMSSYSGQFTIQQNPVGATPSVTGNSPASNVPVAPNVLPQIAFDHAMLASTINATTVKVYDTCSSTFVAGTPSVVGTGNNIIQFTPAANLTALCNTSPRQFYMQVNTNSGSIPVTDTDGVPVNGQPYFYFTVTTPTNDTTKPTVTGVSPGSGTQNVGINAAIYVQFSKPIDTNTVNASTIVVTAGSQTIIPYSYSFNSTYNTVTIGGTVPLPASSTITVSINGVTDLEGNVVAPYTSTFTTAADVVYSAPSVTAWSFTPNGNVPLNTTAFTVTFNRPMNPLSVTTASMQVHDTTTNMILTAVSVTPSADMMSFTLLVNPGQIALGDYLYVQTQNAMDVTGNNSGSPYAYFTASASDTTPPTVTEIDPLPGLTGIPTNIQPTVEFSKEISTTSALTGIQLLQGSTVIPTTLSLSRGDTVVLITPTTVLAPSTPYTISVNGVTDVEGTAISSSFTSSFTTSTGVSLISPTIVSFSPANGAIHVPDNVTPTVTFSSQMNPISFDPALNYARLYVTSTNTNVPTTISFSADGKTATFTPTSPLVSGTQYTIYIYYYVNNGVANYNTVTSSSFTAN